MLLRGRGDLCLCLRLSKLYHSRLTLFMRREF